VKAAWDEATRRSHGNPFIALETVLNRLGLDDYVATSPSGHRVMREAERTPEVVLRAMLRAYEAAALEAMIEHHRAPPDSPEERKAHTRARRLHRDALGLRVEIAGLVCGFPMSADWDDASRTDYEARLRGERPLDAPPAE
jgi:hypothetical protein